MSAQPSSPTASVELDGRRLDFAREEGAVYQGSLQDVSDETYRTGQP